MEIAQLIPQGEEQHVGTAMHTARRSRAIRKISSDLIEHPEAQNTLRELVSSVFLVLAVVAIVLVTRPSLVFPALSNYQDQSAKGGFGEKQMSVSISSPTNINGEAMHASENLLTAQGEAKSRVSNSGIRGTTIFRIYSGMPEGKTLERTSSMEFAIAPIEGDNPVYGKATFIKSDEQGNYEVALPPGKYWIGPKAKALDPKFFESPTTGIGVFSERIVAVQEGIFTHADVFQESFAP